MRSSWRAAALSMRGVNQPDPGRNQRTVPYGASSAVTSARSRWNRSSDSSTERSSRIRWLASSCPSAAMRATIGSLPVTRSPMMKNVARARCRASTSSSCGVVCGCGPSSKVSATAGASVST